MSAKISAVIPVYNGERFLRECIESVLAQSLRPDEIVVCDDASTDETPKILAEYSTRLYVIRNERNVGVGPSLNRAIEQSSGTYVAILAADDRWMPDHLNRMASLLEKFPQAGVAFAPVRLIGLKQGTWPNVAAIPCYSEPRFVLLSLMRNNFVHPCGAVFRRSVWEDIGGFQEIEAYYRGRRVQAEDYDFWLRTATRYPFVADTQPTAEYRWHPAQSSQHIAAQYVLTFRYRQRLLEQLRLENHFRNLLPSLETACVVAWEEYLGRVWRDRDLAGLRHMVAYGLRNRLLRPSTWYYASRAMFPYAWIKFRDRYWRRK